MNKITRKNALRFFVLLLVQGLILRFVGDEMPNFPYLNLFLYPLFILLLPVDVPRPLVVLLGFLMGIAVDMFYHSPGLHAGASVATAYFRNIALRMFEPLEGYRVNDHPTLKRMGFLWFVRYAAPLLLLHCFIYFSLETFNFYYLGDILLKTLFCFLFSMSLLLAVQAVLGGKD